MMTIIGDLTACSATGHQWRDEALTDREDEGMEVKSGLPQQGWNCEL
jgi:hypothetical protein